MPEISFCMNKARTWFLNLTSSVARKDLCGQCEHRDGIQKCFFFFLQREREEKQQNSIFLLYSQPWAPVSPNSHSKQYRALSVSVLFIEFSARVLLYICVHAECLLLLLLPPGYEWWSTSPCLVPQRWQGWWCEAKKVKEVAMDGRRWWRCLGEEEG